MNEQQDITDFYNAIYAFEKSPTNVNVCTRLKKECIRYGMYHEAFQLGMWMGQLQLSAERESEIPRRVENFSLLIIVTCLLGGGLLYIPLTGLWHLLRILGWIILGLGNLCIVCKIYEAILRAGK